MKIENLHDLYVHSLKDLYSAEKQLVKALPKMAKNATDKKLKKGFEDHLEETKRQVGRLEEIFEGLEKKPGGMKCKGMEGLISEAEELLKDKPESAAVLDAGLIAAAQKVEHYEIATYGTAVEWARVMGHDKHVRLLQKTLDEEYKTNEKLTKVAESAVNPAASEMETAGA